MKATSKSPKVPVIEIALAVIALGIAGFVAVYVLRAKQTSNELLKQADKSTAQASAVPKTDLLVSTAKLPAGWTVSEATNRNVVLKSDDGSCFASVGYNPEGTKTDSEVSSPNTTNAGYPVRQLGASSTSLQTIGGSVPVSTRLSQIGTGAQSTYQSFGSVTSGPQQTTVSTSCAKQSNLTVAGQALQAVTVNNKFEF